MVLSRATITLLAFVSFVLVACSGSTSPEPTTQPQVVTEATTVPEMPTEEATVVPAETHSPAPTVAAPVTATAEPTVDSISSATEVPPQVTAPLPTEVPPTAVPFEEPPASYVNAEAGVALAIEAVKGRPASRNSIYDSRLLSRAIQIRGAFHLATAEIGSYQPGYEGYDAWVRDYVRQYHGDSTNSGITHADLGRHVRQQATIALSDPDSEIGTYMRIVETVASYESFDASIWIWWEYVAGPGALFLSFPEQEPAWSLFEDAAFEYKMAHVSNPDLPIDFGTFLDSTGYTDDFFAPRGESRPGTPTPSPSSESSIPVIVDAEEFSGDDLGSLRVLPLDAGLFGVEDGSLSVSIPPGDEEYFWAYSSATTDLQDGAVTARIHLDGTDAGGVMARAAFDANGNLVDVYACLIRDAPTGSGFGCYRRGDFEWTMLASQDSEAVTPNAWNDVELRVTGEGIEFFINGQRAFSWRDPDPLGSGYWGAYLRRYNGSTGSSITYDFIRIHEYQ